MIPSLNLRILLPTCSSHNWLSCTHQILFLPHPFLVKYRFPLPILCFFSAKIQKLVSQEMFLKRANTCRLCFAKLKAQIILLLSFLKTISGFLVGEVWIQGNITTWPMAKCIQLWTLKQAPFKCVQLYMKEGNTALLCRFLCLCFRVLRMVWFILEICAKKDNGNYVLFVYHNTRKY